jgi:hypothetical protein
MPVLCLSVKIQSCGLRAVKKDDITSKMAGRGRGLTLSGSNRRELTECEVPHIATVRSSRTAGPEGMPG